MSTRPKALDGCDVLPPMEPDRPRPKPKRAPKSQRTSKRGRKAGSGRFAVLNRFVDESMRKLDRTAACVWLVLYRDTKRDGTVQTGQTDIARRCDVCVRTVYAALETLRKHGLLTVIRKGRLGSGPTVYRIFPDCREQN